MATAAFFITRYISIIKIYYLALILIVYIFIILINKFNLFIKIIICGLCDIFLQFVLI
ncbi:putative membrane protein [Escherichia coli DEC2A]|nr:putative membrane protein [Escherichia coli DEC2A]